MGSPRIGGQSFLLSRINQERKKVSNKYDLVIILWGPHFLQTAIKAQRKIIKFIRKFLTGSVGVSTLEVKTRL